MTMVKDVEFMTHFESGLGIGIRGKLDERDISIIKLTPNLDRSLLVNGKIISNPTLENYCRTQIEVKLEDEEEMYQFLKEQFGNHVIIVYGNIIRTYWNLMHFYDQKRSLKDSQLDNE